jgi:protein-tyrosine-phosphatase
VPSPPFELVVVCTGNRFRSPLLEAMLRARLDPDRVHVRSLGTLELGPRPAYDEAIALGRRYGVDLSGHRSRSLVGEDLSATELCIGFERQHIVKAVVEARLPRERGFLVLPLVQRLAQEELPPAGDQAEHAREALLPLLADATRLQHGAELEDPAGGSPAVFERVADELDRLATELAALLFGVRATRTR